MTGPDMAMEPGRAAGPAGYRLQYRSLLLASGARARRLPFGGAWA